MKRNTIFLTTITLILGTGYFNSAFSQNVGINTTGANPHTSAILDVDAAPGNNKGMLVPRIALQATNLATPVTSPATSLLVYNTATAGVAPNNVLPGFYYWNGTVWVLLQTANLGWGTSGNAGTIAGTNFLGTTDNQDLDLRTNNTVKLKLTTKGQLEAYNTGGSVFIGEGAGEADDLSNNQNTYVGTYAGKTLPNNNGCVAVGYSAFEFGLSGAYGNVAVGHSALQGFGAGCSGNGNTAVGGSGLQRNTTGVFNCSFGSSSLRFNTTGSYNVGIGKDALDGNTFGDHNTAVGVSALGANTIGLNNTALGASAFGTGTSYNNSTALGSQTAITASNQIRLGNNTVTSIGGFQLWTNVSDQRFKKDIQENVQGLNFILKLRPVTYHLDLQAVSRYLNIPDSLRSKENEQLAEAMVQSGFIAQEVEQVAKELGFDFSGVDKPKNEGDFYGLRYAAFVVPLVKAIQEQQTQLEAQNLRIEIMEAQITALMNTVK